MIDVWERIAALREQLADSEKRARELMDKNEELQSRVTLLLGVTYNQEAKLVENEFRARPKPSEAAFIRSLPDNWGD